MNRLLSLFAICLCQFALFAQTAQAFGTANNDDPVTVVWTLSNPTNISAYTATPDDVFASISVDIGDIETSGPSTTVTAIYPDNSNVSFTRFKPSGSTSSIEWKLLPAEGITFTPTKISAYIARFGTDAQNGITIKAVADDGAMLTLGTFTAPRNNKTQEEDRYGSNDNYTSRFVIELTEEQQKFLTTKDSISVYGTLGVNSSKEASYADFTIEGFANRLITMEPAELSEGRYYLKNVGSQKWLAAGNSWGTQASLLPHAEYVTLHAADGYYTIETQEDNAGGNGSNGFYQGWMDSSQQSHLLITLGSDGYYRLTDADNGSTLGYDGETTVLYTSATGINACWQFFTEEQMLAELAKATADAPVDATWKILDPNFGRNNTNVNAWNVSNDCTNYNLSGGDINTGINFCAESWHSTFNIYQTITGVPNGTYTLKAQGFYRQDGNDEVNTPVFYLNSGTDTTPVNTALLPFKEGSENSMADASASFSNGNYTCNAIRTYVSDGTITIGVACQNSTLWCIWDNFELTYYGLDDVNVDNYNELLTLAQQLVGDESLSETAATALSTAIVMPIGTSDERAAAIAALSEATEAAQACVIAKERLDGMKALTESTNFYTQEAYNVYYAQWAEKYANGTITKREASELQNPYDLTGWHTPMTADNFLLSVWDTNPDFNNAPYYINSWSIEGNTDGTNFVVPFFEYFVPDNNILEGRTLTATLTGLEKGAYEVSLLARVRRCNYYDNAPYGIYVQVNGDDEVALTDGKQFNTDAGLFCLGTFTAIGYVFGDGVLRLTITVSDDNNISWLSFKDVNYKYAGSDDPRAIGATDWTILKDAYEEMNGNAWYNQWIFGDEPTTARDLPGVKVKNERVTAIDLSGNNLQGTFPAALLKLEKLETLNLADNALEGDVAEAMADFEGTISVKTLNIRNNQLGGNIGAFAQKFANLTALYAGGNRFDAVSPMISPNVTDIDLSNLTWDVKVTLSAGALFNGTALVEKLPTIMTYNHFAQKYAEPTHCVYQADDWYVEWYNNERKTYFDGFSHYYGKSGNEIWMYGETPSTNFSYPVTLTFNEGDTNFDDAIDVLDLQADVNFMFNETASPFNFTAANLWADDGESQQINLQDIILEVNLLLAQVEEPTAPARIDITSSVEEFTAEATMKINAEGRLVLTTTRPVAAFDITIGGVQAFEFSELLRQQGIICSTRLQSDGLHIIGYSLKGTVLPIGETELGTISAQEYLGSISVTRATMADKAAQRISVKLNSEVTGISEIEFGKLNIENGIYDLQGRKLNVQSSMFNVQSKKKGIYVNQGRKVIVK